MPLDLANNPFAVLSAVAAPAILTNACSVLALGTANRIARVVDRTREVLHLRAGADSTTQHGYGAQLHSLRRRGDLLLHALRLFYTGLAMFATTALTAIIGSLVVAYNITLAFHVAALIGLAVGSCGVFALVSGCYLMVRETRLAISGLRAEYEFALRDLRDDKTV